jgi:hypothetical protein
MNSNNGCPRCGFSYGWDGSRCSHCQYEAPCSPSNVSAPAEEENPIAAMFNRACYGEIGPHLDACQQAQDPAHIQAMLEPHHYRRFAENALQSLAALTYDLMGYIYESSTQAGGRDHPEVQELQPHFSFLHEIRSRLGNCGGAFFQTLGHYEQLLMGFRYKQQQAGVRAENQGLGWSILGGIVGGLLLGPLGGIAAACGSAYFGGSLIDSELQRDTEQLNLAFSAMLGEYDNLMNELRGMCGQMLDAYQHTVTTTVQRVLQGAGSRKLPF